MDALIYLSFATADMDRDGLNAILSSARRRNGENGVTGMLIFGHGAFIQVLEADTVALDETMSRIEADDRHRNLRVLHRTAIHKRGFPEWTMAFEGAPENAEPEGLFQLTRKSFANRLSIDVDATIDRLARAFYSTVSGR